MSDDEEEFGIDILDVISGLLLIIFGYTVGGVPGALGMIYGGFTLYNSILTE